MNSSLLYIFYFLFLITFSFAISSLIILKKTRRMLLAMIIWGLFVWLMYFIVLEPSWILANGDLIYMLKIVNYTVADGRYPFENQELQIIRPNYLMYPTPFLIQAILSIVTGIRPEMLIYIPITMFATYTIVIIVVSLLMRNSPISLLPFIVLPLFNFLAINMTAYFVYSHISRALIILSLYFIFTKRTQVEHRYLLWIQSILLIVATVMGHSQEPITLVVLLIIFTIFFLSLRIVIRNSKAQLYRGTSLFILFTSLFIVILLLYDIYVAMDIYKGIITFIYNFINALLGRASIEVAMEKSTIAQTILTPLEFNLMLLGYLSTVVYIAIKLFSFLILAVREKDYQCLSYISTVIVYSVITVIPLLTPGIGTDLFWRPIWALFSFTSIGSITFCKYDETGRGMWKRLLTIFVTIIIAFLFLSNIIYLRLHLIPSEVYIHESKTISILYQTLSYSNFLDLFKESTIYIIDTPTQPAYEISKAFFLILQSNPKYNLIFSNCSIQSYSLTYFNGIIKLRGYPREMCIDYSNFKTTLQRGSIVITDEYEFSNIFSLIFKITHINVYFVTN